MSHVSVLRPHLPGLRGRERERRQAVAVSGTVTGAARHVRVFVLAPPLPALRGRQTGREGGVGQAEAPHGVTITGCKAGRGQRERRQASLRACRSPCGVRLTTHGRPSKRARKKHSVARSQRCKCKVRCGCVPATMPSVYRYRMAYVIDGISHNGITHLANAEHSHPVYELAEPLVRQRRRHLHLHRGTQAVVQLRGPYDEDAKLVGTTLRLSTGR